MMLPHPRCEKPTLPEIKNFKARKSWSIFTSHAETSNNPTNELKVDQNVITAGKRTQLQNLVSPGYREDLDSGGFFCQCGESIETLPTLFLVTVVLIMYMEVITHGLLFQLHRLPLSSMSSQQILWRACDVQLGTPLLEVEGTPGYAPLGNTRSYAITARANTHTTHFCARQTFSPHRICFLVCLKPPKN